MAGAFHGTGEPECVITGVSGPGVVHMALKSCAGTFDVVAETIKRPRSRLRAWVSLWPGSPKRLGVPFAWWISPLLDTRHR